MIPSDRPVVAIDSPLQDPVIPLVEPSDKNTTMRLLGLAIFREDRLVGILDDEESILLEMLHKARLSHPA